VYPAIQSGSDILTAKHFIWGPQWLDVLRPLERGRLVSKPYMRLTLARTVPRLSRAWALPICCET
jgi:hypothetical protein